MMKIKDINHCKSIIYLYLYNIKITPINNK
nr:MAG TPA: hypothetical protein [Caudoviricetes sp.]